MKNKLLICILSIILIFAGCSKNSSEADFALDSRASEPASAPLADESSAHNSISGAEFELQKDTAFAQNSKIIKTGFLSMEMENFYDNLANIKEITLNYGGYVEASDMYVINNNGRDINSARLTLRIPAESFETASAEIKNLGKVTQYSDSTQDVTSQYYDTESRLNTKKIEEKRLLDLLEKAENIEDILAIEKRLSEVRTDIEIFEASLKNMDDVVSYSTLNIDVKEAANTTIETFNKSLPERVAGGFKSSFNFTVRLIEGLILFITYISVPGVILLVSLFIGFQFYKRTKVKSKNEK